MPQTTEAPQVGVSTGTPSGFFNSAFMEIESYFDFPAGCDSKCSQDSFRSPRITPSTSPTVNPQFRASPSGAWGSSAGRDSLGPPSFLSYSNSNDLSSIKNDVQLGSNSRPPNSIAPLQITKSFSGQPSPPNSLDSPPEKYALLPGDISPLDSLISHMPSDGSGRVHGQVTPPDDSTKSPKFSNLPPALVLSMQLTPPEGSPAGSPRSLSPQQREMPSSSGHTSCSGGTSGATKRRRSPNGQTNNSRKQRKSVSVETEKHPQEVQEAKRRRFLERNRVAASKCRQKKKAWMQDLETDAREAQNMSRQLKACVGVLKEEVLQLKNELLKHNTCDCLPIRQYLSNEAIRLAEGGMTKASITAASNCSSALRPPSSEISTFTATNSATDVDVKASADDLVIPQPEFDLSYVDNAEETMT